MNNECKTMDIKCKTIRDFEENVPFMCRTLDFYEHYIKPPSSLKLPFGNIPVICVSTGMLRSLPGNKHCVPAENVIKLSKVLPGQNFVTDQRIFRKLEHESVVYNYGIVTTFDIIDTDEWCILPRHDALIEEGIIYI